jgi:hypothetical protein
MPVRIYEIAKKTGIPSRVVLEKAREWGIPVAKGAASTLDKITAGHLEDSIRSDAKFWLYKKAQITICEIAERIGIPSRIVLEKAKDMEKGNFVQTQDGFLQKVQAPLDVMSVLDQTKAEQIENEIRSDELFRSHKNTHGIVSEPLNKEDGTNPSPLKKEEGIYDDLSTNEITSQPRKINRSEIINENNLREIHSNLKDLRKEHPQLVLLEDYFEWPTTKVSEYSSGILCAEHWPQEEGLLRTIGYRVGNDGIALQLRRDILNHVYISDHLPMVKDVNYMLEWGEKKTAKRLLKIVNLLTYLCRSIKRKKDQDNARAILDWENDLDWLKINFYVGKYDKRHNR